MLFRLTILITLKTQCLTTLFCFHDSHNHAATNIEISFNDYRFYFIYNVLYNSIASLCLNFSRHETTYKPRYIFIKRGYNIMTIKFIATLIKSLMPYYFSSIRLLIALPESLSVNDRCIDKHFVN